MRTESSRSQRNIAATAEALLGPSGAEVIALHGPDGRFKTVSASAARLFGMPPEALIGRRLSDLIVAEHQTTMLEALATLASVSGPGIARFDACLRGPEAVTAEFSLARTARGFRSVIRSIDDRLARERAARDESSRIAKSVARRAEQLANVSHEIRTPLNAVIGFADAIHAERFGPLANDRYRDYARIIHDSGQHLLALISDILDLSRAEANATTISLAPESPADLAQFCIELMSLRAAEAGLKLHLQVGPGLGRAALDAKIIKQILLNLLSNAIKFTESGEVSLRVAAEQGQLSFVVTDTGVGMSPDDLARIGERFLQAREHGVRGQRGTGIGLALATALARVHGGELRVQSEVGTGTIATLRVPLISALIDKTSEAQRPAGNVHRLPIAARRH